MSWAVVTGAGKGIGAVIARHAAKEGYRVAAWDIDGAAAAAVAADLGDAVLPFTVEDTPDSPRPFQTLAADALCVAPSAWTVARREG